MHQTSYDPVKPLLLNSETLLGSLEAAAERGIDISSSLSNCGIEARFLKSPSGFMPFHNVVNFLEDVASRFDFPDFGLLVGKHRPALRFGVPIQLAKLSPDLGSAINNAIEYSVLNSQESIWQLKCDGGFAFVMRLDRIIYEGSLVQLHTLAVTLVFRMLTTLCGERLRPSSISFAHSSHGTSRLYEHIFNCPVFFNENFTGIVFPEHYLQLPIKTADAELFVTVQNYLDLVKARTASSDDIPTGAYYCIKKNLGTSICNLEGIAEMLGLHPRTLQRELRKTGVTFRQLLLNVRQEVAEYYLSNSNITLVNLADILGYRNVSALSRAFKSNGGVSPEKWRRTESGA